MSPVQERPASVIPVKVALLKLLSARFLLLLKLSSYLPLYKVRFTHRIFFSHSCSFLCLIPILYTIVETHNRINMGKIHLTPSLFTISRVHETFIHELDPTFRSKRTLATDTKMEIDTEEDHLLVHFKLFPIYIHLVHNLLSIPFGVLVFGFL